MKHRGAGGSGSPTTFGQHHRWRRVAPHPRLDTHQLGVIALVLDKARGGAGAFLATLAAEHPERSTGLTSWVTPTFEVTSDTPIDIGLDGESMVMEPALRLSIRPLQSAFGCQSTLSATHQRHASSAGRKELSNCGRSSWPTPPVSTPERTGQSWVPSARPGT